jgi:hypothetical protein
MNELHNLLKRQLRRFTGETKPSINKQTKLLQAVNDAYWQFDEDRRMLAWQHIRLKEQAI